LPFTREKFPIFYLYYEDVCMIYGSFNSWCSGWIQKPWYKEAHEDLFQYYFSFPSLRKEGKVLPHHVNSWIIPVDLGIVFWEYANFPEMGTVHSWKAWHIKRRKGVWVTQSVSCH